MSNNTDDSSDTDSSDDEDDYINEEYDTNGNVIFTNNNKQNKQILQKKYKQEAEEALKIKNENNMKPKEGDTEVYRLDKKDFDTNKCYGFASIPKKYGENFTETNNLKYVGKYLKTENNGRQYDEDVYHYFTDYSEPINYKNIFREVECNTTSNKGGKSKKCKKTNRKKTNRRKTNRKKTNRKKTNRRKTNRNR